MLCQSAEYAKILRDSRQIPERSTAFRFFLLRNPTKITIDRTVEKCTAGQMLYCAPEVSLQIVPTEDCCVLDCIEFRPAPAEAEKLTALPVTLNAPSAPPNFSELTGLTRSVYHLFYSADKYRTEKLDLHLWNIIYATASGDESAQGLHGMGLLRYQMQQIRKQISDNPRSFPSVNAAAQSIGLSVSRFQHLYRQLFSTGYTQDLIRVRMKRARALLDTTDWTVARIAQELGYENETFFYRQFRQQVGLTPMEYRKLDLLFF